MEFAASDDPPSRIDLVELYASLSENAEDVSKHFLPENSYKNGGDFIYIQAFENGKFVGVLRAWFDKASKRGIVYEVAVRREYQEKHAGHFLVKQLQTKFGRNCGMASQDWIGYPYRAAQKLDRDLNIIRTIYGMSLSLAFGNILNAFREAAARLGLGDRCPLYLAGLCGCDGRLSFLFYGGQCEALLFGTRAPTESTKCEATVVSSPTDIVYPCDFLFCSLRFVWKACRERP